MAVICGAEGWSDVELFAKNKKDWLETFLKLPKGIRSRDTFGRVFAKTKSEEFQKRFIEWVRAIEMLTAGHSVEFRAKITGQDVRKKLLDFPNGGEIVVRL